MLCGEVVYLFSFKSNRNPMLCICLLKCILRGFEASWKRLMYGLFCKGIKKIPILIDGQPLYPFLWQIFYRFVWVGLSRS